MTVVTAVPPFSSESAGGETPRWKRVVRYTIFALLGLFAATLPWTGPWALAKLDFFHVRRIEFDGVRYARTSELVSTLAIDTSRSILHEVAPLESVLTTHPLVRSVDIERRLPGTLIVHVTEREPVAFVPRDGVLTPTDAEGHELPIDPSRTPIDVPIVTEADTVILGVLDDLRLRSPGIYDRVALARRAGSDHLVFDLGGVLVRTRDNVTVARFLDILPVEADLARENLRAAEFDLRFQKQVIVRRP